MTKTGFLMTWLIWCWLKENFGQFSRATHEKMCLRESPTSQDTNRPAQPQKLASLEISAIESRDIILSKQRTTKALIRLRGCAFVVRIWHKTSFLMARLIYMLRVLIRIAWLMWSWWVPTTYDLIDKYGKLSSDYQQISTISVCWHQEFWMSDICCNDS